MSGVQMPQVPLRPGRPGFSKRTRLVLAARLTPTPAPDGPVGLLLADSSGTIACADLGPLRRRGRRMVASGRAGGGTVSVALGAGGSVAVTGRRLALRALDSGAVTLGLHVGGEAFVGTAAFQARSHGRWVRR